MKKEQEVELDKLSTYLDYAKTDNLEEVIVSTKTIETVLNILKEKIAEVEIHTGLEHFYKKDYLDKAELLREANAKLKEKDKEIEKKNKIINEMIEEYEYNDRINFKNFCDEEIRKDKCIENCTICTIQYFERKANDEN